MLLFQDPSGTAHYANDIALIRLTSDITYTDAIRPVCVSGTHMGDNVDCWASGWGSTAGPGNSTHALLKHRSFYQVCVLVYISAGSCLITRSTLVPVAAPEGPVVSGL